MISALLIDGQQQSTYYAASLRILVSCVLPLTFAITKIKEANEYVEASPFPAKLALRFVLGSSIGCIWLPITIMTVIFVDSVVSRYLGGRKYTYIMNKSPMYGGKRLSAMKVGIKGPIREELFYRWIVHYAAKIPIEFTASFLCGSELANKIGSYTAIIFSGIYFGVSHADTSTNIYVSLPQVIAQMSHGFILGVEKEFGGGIVMSIADHMTSNSIVLLLGYIFEKFEK